MTQIKICGITRSETLTTLAKAGVEYAGFVCVENSSRFLPPDRAVHLASQTPPTMKQVALFSNATDEWLDSYLIKMQPDFLQLHGGETPARVSEIRARYRKPIIKAFALSTADDLSIFSQYEKICDWLLFDAKPANNGQPSGGSGTSFDWRLLAGKRFSRPWMLAGGLNTENIRHALDILKPDAVDVSSGVEISAGHKDNQKIEEFVNSVRDHDKDN